MRRLKRWAAVLLAVTLAAGNIPATYVRADGYDITEQTSENISEEGSESEEAADEAEQEPEESETTETTETTEETGTIETTDTEVPDEGAADNVSAPEAPTEQPSEEQPAEEVLKPEESQFSEQISQEEDPVVLEEDSEEGPVTLPEEKKYTYYDDFSIKKTWNDAQDSSKRPDGEEKDTLFKLYYVMLDHSASDAPVSGYKEFTKENTEADFGEAWWSSSDPSAEFPSAQITENGSAWTYSYQNLLPEQVTVTDENEEQHVYDVYYAVKETWNGNDVYTRDRLVKKDGSWSIEKEQLNASEENGTEPTLKTPEQAGGDNVTVTNTRCKDPFTVTINWKDNSNTYLTRPGCHKAGDLYNYQQEDGSWFCRTLTAEEAEDLNQKELEQFKAGLILKAQTEHGEDLPVENAEMEITGLDSDTWTIQIKGLPSVDEQGNQVTYYLEHNHQSGISVNNVPNSKEEKDARIWANPGGEYKTSIVSQGVDTGDADKIYAGSSITNTLEKNIWIMFRSVWEDEGADKENRPSPVIYLYRTAETGTDKAVDFGRLHPVPDHDSVEVPRNQDSAEIEVGYKGDGNGDLPLYDADGRRYIYYAIVHMPNAGDYVQLITNIGTYGDQALEEANKEGYLLSMGTLTLRRQAKISLTATKTFVADSMQDLHTLNNVSVTLMLQKCEDGETWENVTEENGELVTRELTGFRGEKLTVTSDDTYSAPKYNEKGVEIKYRWVETSMSMNNQSVTAPEGEYFKEDSIQTPKGADGKVDPIGPGAGGKNSTAHFRVYYKEDGSVVNRLMGNTEVVVTKDWAQTGWGTDGNMSLADWLASDEGAPYRDGTITFRLNRSDGKSSIPEGEEKDSKTLCRYSVNDDGTVVREEPVRDITIDVGETLTADDYRNIWDYLPRYDENSQEYIYSVEEIYNGTAIWQTSKTYTKEVVYDETHDDYYVQKQVHFVNSPNDGEMSFQVGKVWLDNGDLICRKPVQIALYHKDTNGWSQVKGIGADGEDYITLDNSSNWFRKFSVQAVDGDSDYAKYLLVEVKIGDQGKVQLLGNMDEIAERSKNVPTYYDETDTKNYSTFFGGKEGESAEKTAERQRQAVVGTVVDENGSTGLNHNYNVYLATDQKGAYTIYNQRTGTVNMDVTKTWKTGSDLNEAAVLAITQNGKQIVWLKLDKAQNNKEGYSNSWSSGKDAVLTKGSEGTDIPAEALKNYDTSTLYQNGDYPKYDGMGKLYRYGIEEEAILNRTEQEKEYTVTPVDQNKKSGNQILAIVETEDEKGEAIYHSYTISRSSSVKYAEHPSDSDQYTYTVTNAREQKLTLTANKVWQDDGSADANRPDITFTLYRTTQYKSAEELLAKFNERLGNQQDMTNIPRVDIEKAQDELINESSIVKVNNESRFLWNTKQNDWYWVSSRFTENERYDENGNPYIYFLIETIPHQGIGAYSGEYHTRYDNAHIGSTVNGESVTTGNANEKLFTPQAGSRAVSTEEVYEPNYLDSGYQDTLSAGVLIVSDGVHSVPVKTTYENGVQSNEIVPEGTEGAVQNYCSYWSHTVINYRVKTAPVSGEKIWQLPGGKKIDESYLPDVTFRLRRESGNGNDLWEISPDDFRKNVKVADSNSLYIKLGSSSSTNAKNENQVIFSGKNKYSYRINNLPFYDKYGQKYIYSVVEEDLNKSYFKMGDHPGESLTSFINVYTGDPRAKLSFTKEWSVGKEPEGSQYTLDPEKGTITVTTNGKSTTTTLPTSLTFKIQGYFTKENGTKGEKIDSAAYTATVKAVYTENGYTLSGDARCDGGDQTKGNTIPNITVSSDSAEGASGITWKVELSNLKSLAPNGSKITYEVTEIVPDGYDGSLEGTTTLQQTGGEDATPVYSGQTFKNVYTGKKTVGTYTSVTVQKKWDDKGYDRTPVSIELKLYRKNAKDPDDSKNDVVIEDKIQLKKASNWQAIVGKDNDGNSTLPVYAPDGQKYAYYLTEITGNPNYELTGSKHSYDKDENVTVTATNTLPTGKIYFKKQWETKVDEQDAVPLTSARDFDRLLNLGALPKVTFQVQYLDEVTDPGNPEWKNLSRSTGLVQVTYDPKTDPDKYKKELFDNGQLSFTVPLYKQGYKDAGTDGENYQKYQIVETAVFPDGTENTLVSADITAGDKAEAGTTLASITNTIPVVQVEIIKHWEDNDNRDGMRPTTLSTYIQTKTPSNKWKKMEETAKASRLVSDTTVTEEEKQAGNTYTTGIMLLPKDHQSLKITEVETAGYTAKSGDPVPGSADWNGTKVTTYTFTNTYAPKLFHISAEKQWNDEDDKYGLRNENGSIDLTLWYRFGTDGEWKKVTTAPQELIRTYIVNGKEKIYYGDSTAVYTTTSLNEDQSLTCTPGEPAVWKNLPANAVVNGNTVTVQYKITESGDNKAYTGTISDSTIQFKNTDGETQNVRLTNSLRTTSLTIRKDWKQEEQVTDGKNYRPDEIAFQVEYRAGTDGDWNKLPDGFVTLSKSENWTTTLTGLPVCDKEGKNYSYRVSEVSLTYKKLLGIISNIDQVTGTFRTEADGTENWTGDAGRYLTTVTTRQESDGSFLASAENALIDRHQQFAIEVSKQWEDGDNRFGLRPDHNGAVLKLQYSLDGGASWADITKGTLNWDNCYEDNYGVYTTSEPQQTAVAASADTKVSPARWEHLPAKVLVGTASVPVLYRVTEPDHSAAYTDQLYTMAADGSLDTPVNYDDSISWKGTDQEVQKYVIVNTMETVSLSISKDWDGEDAVADSEALRPEQIDFKVEYAMSGTDDWKPLPAGIYETGTAGEAVTVSKGGLVSLHAPDWKMSLQGLAKTDVTGTDYQYRVSEAVLHYADIEDAMVSDGVFSIQEDGSLFWSADVGRYEAELTIRQDTDGNTMVTALNTLIDRYKFVTVEAVKEWQDDDNRFGLRPDQDAAEVTLWYSTDDGANWAEIKEGSLEEGGYYADNKAVYTTSKAQQTAAPGRPARWENLPGKVLVNGRSHLVQYQVREADYPAYATTIGPEQITWEEAEGEVRTVQVKNTMKTTSLSIQKDWTGEAGARNARALRPEQIELKLEYAAGNTTDWTPLPSGTYQTEEGKEVRVGKEGLLQLSEKDGWKQTLTGLPVCNADGQTFHYRVTETRLLYKDGQIYTVKNGDAGRYQASETTIQNTDGTWKAVLTNQLLDRYQARISKHAETLDGSVLEGAGYVLYRPEQMDYYTGQDTDGNAAWGIWNDAKILYTGSDGTVTISGLPRGTYQFVEVAAAKGYRIDSTPIDFTIGDDNIGTICDVHQADLKRTGVHKHDNTSEETTSGTASTELKPVGPPKTGDSNDWRFYAGLSVGLLAAIAVLLRKLKNH